MNPEQTRLPEQEPKNNKPDRRWFVRALLTGLAGTMAGDLTNKAEIKKARKEMDFSKDELVKELVDAISHQHNIEKEVVRQALKKLYSAENPPSVIFETGDGRRYEMTKPLDLKLLSKGIKI